MRDALAHFSGHAAIPYHIAVGAYRKAVENPHCAYGYEACAESRTMIARRAWCLGVPRGRLRGSSGVASIAVGLVCALCVAAAAARELRVCVDSSSPPSLSLRDGASEPGAVALASDRSGDLRPRMRADRRADRHCDVILGLATPTGRHAHAGAAMPGASVSVYRSRWVRRLASRDDPRLRSLRIGVALVDADFTLSSVRALARRGIVVEVIGFAADGESPLAERMLDSLGEGALDVAVLWGRSLGSITQPSATPVAWTAAAGAERGR